MNNVITKTFVMQFYRINTGFFLVLFLLLFGILNGKATIDLHYYIMQHITSSYWFAATAVVVWLLYNLKCISFCLCEIKRPANSFLFVLQQADKRKHLLLWISCHTLLLMPLLIYAGLTISVGVGHGAYLPSGLFAVFQLILIAGSAGLYYNGINNTWRKPLIAIPILFSGIKKGFYSYLLHYSLNARKGTFIGIKVLSLLLLQGMVAANAYEVNKESICVLMMFVVSAHALLPVYYVGFIEDDMAFIRNLPLPAMKRYMCYVFTYGVIFLPELLFLLLNGQHTLPLQLTLSLYAVAIAQLSFYTSLQYIHKMHTDRYFMIVTGFFFASLLFLASFNLWILSITEAVVAIVLFLALHANYEKQ